MYQNIIVTATHYLKNFLATLGAIIILQIILDVIQANETGVYQKESCGMGNISDQKLTNSNSCV